MCGKSQPAPRSNGAIVYTTPEDGVGGGIYLAREGSPPRRIVGSAGDGVDELDLGAIGPGIESNTDLFPDRTNVSFTRVDGSSVRARIFERGVGETLSSGTGASGAAVAAHLGGLRSPVTVALTTPPP